MPSVPSWSGTETAHPSASAAATSRNSICASDPTAFAPRRIAYDGKHRPATASIAHWYDRIGHGRLTSRSAGTTTVVTAAAGVPFMSVDRYSSCVAVTFWGISPRNASFTSRERSTVPGVECWKPSGGA